MAKDDLIKNIFRIHDFRESLKFSLKGTVYLFRYHRNMRLIFLIGIAAGFLGLYLNLKGIELAVLCITITAVFIAEMTNTAIELVMDTITDKYSLKIKIIKDITAAIVVVACLNAAAVGYILIIRKIFR